MGGWLNTAVRFFRNWIFQRWKIQCKNNKQITDRIDSIQKQQQEKFFCKGPSTNVCSSAIKSNILNDFLSVDSGQPLSGRCVLQLHFTRMGRRFLYHLSDFRFLPWPETIAITAFLTFCSWL